MPGGSSLGALLHRLRGVWPLGAAVAAVLLVYWPTTSFGPIAEDLQWGLKGASVWEHLPRLFTPFLHVVRPAATVFFATAFGLFEQAWLGYRALQFVVLAALAAAGWSLMRRHLSLSPTVAGLGIALWLATPLASEVVCVTCEVIQMLLGAGLLGALAAREVEGGRARRVMVALLAGLAMASKEEWVVLPVLVLLQDRLVFGLPARRCLARSVPWWAALGGYLALHRVIVPEGVDWYYQPTLSGMLSKFAVTVGSFLHVLPQVPWEFGTVLREHPFRSAAALLAVVLLAAATASLRDGRAAFALASCVVMLLPTLPGGSQAPRYTLLPWFFFLAGCAILAVRLADRPRSAHVLRPALLAGGALLLAGDVVRARADVDDWQRFAALTGRLRREVRPLLEEARRGRTLVVLRREDGGPLTDLLTRPTGQTKLYFPRPDDPYGVVSLSALLSWQSWPEGFALQRVRALPANTDIVTFVHVDGGFRRIATLPGLEVRHPEHPSRGTPGVIVTPVPRVSFSPAGFP